MPTSVELRATRAAKADEHAAFLAQFKTADGGYDMPSDKVGEFQKRNDELTQLGKDYEQALEVERSAAATDALRAPTGRMVKESGQPEFKAGDRIESKAHMTASFKAAFSGNPGLRAIAEGKQGRASFDLNVDLKTVIATSVHAPQANRQQDTPSALFFGNVEDVFPHGTADSKSIDYFIQTTDTDNAASVAEGSAVTDSVFSWTLTTDPIETVQTWIPMTHEAIADNAGFQSTVTGMLARRLQKKSNALILAGDGNTPNPTGVFARSGFQTQAKGADPAFDAIRKAITLVNVTGDADANAVFMHPTDWQNVCLTRTQEGLYILGNPAGQVAHFLWGLPVYETSGIGAAGTAGVGDTSYASVVEREGVTVEVSTEHSTYFTERKVAVMLYRRFAVADYRPSAFAKVTGL